MKIQAARSFQIFFAGILMSLFLAYIIRPVFWSRERLIYQADALSASGNDLGAITLLEAGARACPRQNDRDLLFQRACTIGARLANEERALAVCSEYAEGPKRPAQADAMKKLALYFMDSGGQPPARSFLEKLESEYWDAPEGIFAGQRLAALRLWDMNSENRIHEETLDEVGALLDKAQREKFFDPAMTAIQMKFIILVLKQNRELPKALFSDYDRYRGDPVVENLLDRLGVLTFLDPLAAPVAAALRASGLPVRNQAADLVRYAVAGENPKAEREKIISSLENIRDAARLAGAFDEAGAASIALRVDLARKMLDAHRNADALALLKNADAQGGAEAGFAEAAFLIGEIDLRQGKIREAAKKWERVVEVWPQHGGVCVRAGRSAADAYLKLKDREAARRVLLAAAQHASGEDRLELNRAALEIP